MLRGAKLVESLIRRSYGPHGIYTLISSKGGKQLTYRRGLVIANNTRSENENERKGIKQMTKVSEEVYGSVGDFSKTAILLAHAMVENGQAAIARGFLPKDVIRGMEKGLKGLFTLIEENRKAVKGKDLYNIAKTAGGGDEKVAQIATEAMKKVGKDGRISVVESDSRIHT